MTKQSNKPELEIEGVSIVLLGEFNPTIFQPSWLSEYELIPKEEAKAAKIKVIHQDVTEFSEWFTLQVLRNRFSVDTQNPSMYLPLKDLVSGIFRILEHTPTTAIGFNSSLHYQMPSIEEWHLMEEYYVPKNSWQRVLKSSELFSLTLSGNRENCQADRIQINLAPSPRIERGVCISINEHYDIGEADFKSQADRNNAILAILQNSWGDFLNYKKITGEYLLEQYKSNGD